MQVDLGHLVWSPALVLSGVILGQSFHIFLSLGFLIYKMGILSHISQYYFEYEIGQ